MVDDDQDKTATRNSIVALMLMAGLLFYMMYFLPKYAQAPQPAAPQPPVAAQPATSRGAETSAYQDTLSERALPRYSALEAPDLNAALPPVASPETPEDEVVLENDQLRLTFTKAGARLKAALIKLGEQHGDPVQLVPDQPDAAEPVYPFSLYFSDAALGDVLNHRRFEAKVDPSGESATFALTVPGLMTVRKSYRLTDRPNVVKVGVDIENHRGDPLILGLDQTPAYFLAWGPNISSKDMEKGIAQTLIWRKDQQNQFLATSKFATGDNGRPALTQVPGSEWLGVKSAYFLVAFKPEFPNGVAMAYGDPKQFRFGIGAPRCQIDPGATASTVCDVYLGPMHLTQLGMAWETLPTALKFYESSTWAWLDWFAKALLNLLNWFYGIIPNYGVAIILLTVLVRVALFPLTLKSMKSMKRMSLLAPEMEEIKKKYPDNPQEQQRKIMELYRERGISPLSGCLPMLLQMPVFFALYRMLLSAFELRGAPFLWIEDLSQPDRLFRIPGGEVIPFFGGALDHFNILPVLMALAMVVSQKIVPASGPSQNPQQKIIMTVMPVFFSVICYNMASGLNLYILVSTLLGIAQQPLIKVSQADVTAKRPPRKRMHFYAAAQARKRRMAKEAKEDSKRAPKPKS